MKDLKKQRKELSQKRRIMKKKNIKLRKKIKALNIEIDKLKRKKK